MTIAWRRKRMKISILLSTLSLIFLTVTTFAQADQKIDEKEIPGAINKKLIEKWNNISEPSGKDKRLVENIIRNGINSVALNESIIRKHDKYFTHEIKSGTITNQKRSGRCWMFAGFNVIRPAVVKQLNVDDFEFSQSYLFFWDKIEKSNVFLETMIDRVDVDLRDPKLQQWLSHPLGDGGWWEYFVYLIKKYGAVPKDAMPEVKNRSNSRNMTKICAEKLREYTALIRHKAKEGQSIDELRSFKEECLTDLYKILVYHFGKPPSKFSYRYKSKKDNELKSIEIVKILTEQSNKNDNPDFLDSEAIKEQVKDKVSSIEEYTPQSFAEKYITKKLAEYVVLSNLPSRDFNVLYEMESSRNIFEKPNARCLNVNIEDLKMATLQSILSEEPVWFAADISIDIDRNSGILHPSIYEFNGIFQLKDTRLNKGQRILYGDINPNHAMVLMGVDYIKEKIIKWLVENSWGTDIGKKGYLHMYDEWFDDNVLMCVIAKKYLPQRLIKLLDSKPVIIKEDEAFAKLLRADTSY